MKFQKIFSMILTAVLLFCTDKSFAAKNPEYKFKNGFPTEETTKISDEDSQLDLAIQLYKVFYPTVSGYSTFAGPEIAGQVPNQQFVLMDTKPHHAIFTAGSDMPLGILPLDLKDGPIVMEIPKGPLTVIATDIHQNWIADLGISGPDRGNGGKHLFLPPDFKGKSPEGFHVWRSHSYKTIATARAVPLEGNINEAMDRIKKIKVYPLGNQKKVAAWEDITAKRLNVTPTKWENNIKFWEKLQAVIESEPAHPDLEVYNSTLAAVGIQKGKPFAPSNHMFRILESAAKKANAQLRVTAFADKHPDRFIWSDRKWEWISLRFENASFKKPDGTLDISARDKWFYQAVGPSPSLFRRQAGIGSISFLSAKDSKGEYLDGGKNYKLIVPQPVPSQMFWSVTVYDAEMRSQIQTSQSLAALRSLFELRNLTGQSQVELYFGPEPPVGKEDQWIQTSPDKGWFAYFRVYGPEPRAFDGTWKPGDFTEVRTFKAARK